MQEISIETFQKKENKKWKYQREICHMNADLNEKLKQYQRNQYVSKKKKKLIFVRYKHERTDTKIEFHASKQPVALYLVDTKKIVVSGKFKYGRNVSKYFIGYLDDDDDDDDDDGDDDDDDDE